MARLIPHWDISPTLAAAQHWIAECLIGDGSLLTTDALWTPILIEEARAAFVDHPDAGKDDFLTKLKGQLQTASPAAQRLMGEMLWALLLFPSNVKPQTKRQQVESIWSLSGEPTPPNSQCLSDDVLVGIGSGGPGFNNHRWRELTFLLELTTKLKQDAADDRRRVLTDYDAFVAWIATVPQPGQRQFRHMLRYLAFPDRVERMSSNRHRWDVLSAFGVAPEPVTKKWSDAQLDTALLELRRTLEAQSPGEITDFYSASLKPRWMPDDDGGDDDAATPSDVAPAAAANTPSENPAAARSPVNLILYGPPGTGKTHWLRQKMKDYSDTPDVVDSATWANELLAPYGWRPLVVVALSELGGVARVPEICAHPLLVAKAKQRGRSASTLQRSIWGYLQDHTPEAEEVAIAKSAVRRPPYTFTKRETGEWSLLPDWQELDDEAAELARVWKQGPTGAREPVRRYRVVTFHPSFSYEDFVRGIRPVVIAEDGTTQFRVVDGVFKRICDEARADPGKRYALFIDEINRANIAKVFGELITLIEPDKRAKFDAGGRQIGGMSVQLAGADDGDTIETPFGVPANLDLYGTMNTADRSVALLDIALRRRFEFREMEPDYTTLDWTIEQVHLGNVLRRINDRLEFLLDREHRIGHAYLIGAQTIDDLRRVFHGQIIPLLQEFFFDDLGRVAMVLATAGAAPPFVRRTVLAYEDLFDGERADRGAAERARYTVTRSETWTAKSFVALLGIGAADSDNASL